MRSDWRTYEIYLENIQQIVAGDKKLYFIFIHVSSGEAVSCSAPQCV
jgi:hypothetical protein